MFKIGDLVVLKSGGPMMTVLRAGTEERQAILVCGWFDQSSNAHQGNFPPDVLVAAKSTDYVELPRRLQGSRAV